MSASSDRYPASTVGRQVPATRANPQMAARLALLLLLGGETILFGTLVSSYLFIRAEAGAASLLAQSGLERIWMPAINTLVLLLSAAAAWYAVRSIRKDRRLDMENGLSWALALGLLFVALQVIEFSKSGMRPNDPSFGGIYMALIGFHAVHVLAGVVFVGLNLLRARLGDFSARGFIPVEMGAWFWYYVTAVWLVLFAVLYLV
jgi:cytochrome c oxidase subunit III